MAEINVTPLVDVILVLLIISMVAAPMLQRGINLELPATESATEIDEARVVVSVDRDATIRINDRPVHAELLTERMRTLAANRPDETVFLQGHKGLPYGDVLSVMDRIRQAGVTRIALVTVPVEEEAGGRR
jgi:biopolymer transport protein ExbD